MKCIGPESMMPRTIIKRKPEIKTRTWGKPTWWLIVSEAAAPTACSQLQGCIVPPRGRLLGIQWKRDSSSKPSCRASRTYVRAAACHGQRPATRRGEGASVVWLYPETSWSASSPHPPISQSRVADRCVRRQTVLYQRFYLWAGAVCPRSWPRRLARARGDRLRPLPPVTATDTQSKQVVAATPPVKCQRISRQFRALLTLFHFGQGIWLSRWLTFQVYFSLM